MNKKKVVLFGLSSDPPHLGHLQIVHDVQKTLGLDTHIVVMPTGTHPFKKKEHIDSKDRLALTQILFKDMPHVEVDDFEIKKKEACFTYDTLIYLKSKFSGAMIYFVMSTESASQFFSWNKPFEILCLATPYIVERQGSSLEPSVLHKLSALCHPIFSYHPIVNVSSTSLRQMLKLNLSPKELNHDQLNYINQHNLYR